jgi:endo-1,4-beta-xylanase
MFNRRDFLTLTSATAASQFLNFAQEASAQPLVPKPSINVIPFGTTLRMDFFNTQSDYRAAILQYAQECQLEGNHLMGHLKKQSREQFDTDLADMATRFCQNNNLRMHGHAIVFPSATPKWLTTMTSDLELDRFLNSYIEQLFRHFKTSCYQWNVVNEVYGYTARHRTDFPLTVWSRLMGESYIDKAFKKAREVSPSTKLIFSEEGIYYSRDDLKIKRQSFEQLLFSLLDRGVPIDGVAIQGHILGHFNLDIEGFSRTLERIKKAGLSVCISELDVIDTQFPTDFALRDAMVAAKLFEFLKTVTDVVKPTSIHSFGITDKYTWLDFMGKRQDKTRHRNLPLDEFYRPKLSLQVFQHFCQRGKA